MNSKTGEIKEFKSDEDALKAFNEELAEKESVLRLALDNMTDGIYVIDKDLRYVLANDRIKKMGSAPPGMYDEGTRVSDAIHQLARDGVYGPGEKTT